MTINRATAAPINNARIEFILKYVNIPAIITYQYLSILC